MKIHRPLLAIGAVFALPGAAAACDMVLRHDSPAEIAVHARQIFERSAAIIDAEVIQPTRVVPNRGAQPARLRPIHVLKGPALPVFLVTSSGCDIVFMRRGERVRVVLTGGPELYNASMEDHGMDYADGNNARRLIAALDVLTGVPRPPGFDVPGGEEPPPPPRRRVTRRR